MTYRFFTPAPARSATGPAADVYGQLREEFLGPVPTFQALSAVPELMAATWTMMRESLLAGDASRVDREIVAASVSRANRCRFCVDAHVMLLHALGEHTIAEALARGDAPAETPLIAWAEASRSPRATGWTPQTAELTGTVEAFHFINRMVSALLDPDLLPGGLQRSPMVRSVGGRLYAKIAREHREHRDSPEAAYRKLRGVAEQGGELLGDLARQTVAATVSWEDGRHPDRPREWAVDLVADLPAIDRVGTRIALLAAFAPSAISPGDVALWRLSHPADADLVRLIAYGAITATDHVANTPKPACLPAYL